MLDGGLDRQGIARKATDVTDRHLKGYRVQLDESTGGGHREGLEMDNLQLQDTADATTDLTTAMQRQRLSLFPLKQDSCPSTTSQPWSHCLRIT